MGCCAGKSAADQPQPLVPGGAKHTGGSSSASAPVGKDVINGKVKQAKATKALALRECGLRKLPPEATDADTKVLRTVDLTLNALGSLPEAIGVWTGLQNLLCPKNSLTQLPPTIGQLESLQKLVLAENQLGSIPVEISALGKLRILDLNSNKLVRLPAEVFDGAIAGSLEELDLSNNFLEELPLSLSRVPTLTRLAMPNNKLTALPADLGKLSKLQYLDAAENKLTDVPAEILEGTNLSELWLKGNDIDRMALQQKDGFALFMERRKMRLDAKIESHVVGKVNINVCGLE